MSQESSSQLARGKSPIQVVSRCRHGSAWAHELEPPSARMDAHEGREAFGDVLWSSSWLRLRRIQRTICLRTLFGNSVCHTQQRDELGGKAYPSPSCLGLTTIVRLACLSLASVFVALASTALSGESTHQEEGRRCQRIVSVSVFFIYMRICFGQSA